MQPRYPPSTQYPPPQQHRPPARPPARGLGRGCRTALFVTLGVMCAMLLGVGGLAGFLITNTLGTFERYHSLPSLDGTLVTDGEVRAILPSPDPPSCPSFAPSSTGMEEECTWFMAEGDSRPLSLIVTIFLEHGKLLQTGTARAQAGYAYDHANSNPTDMHGVGDQAYIGDGMSSGDERVFEFTDGNVDAMFSYTSLSDDPADSATTRNAALIALGRAAASRLADSRK